MIETDAHIVKILGKFALRKVLPVNSIVKEALALLRAIPTPPPRSEALISARATISNSRSKLVEQRVVILRELALVAGVHEDLQHYAVAKYTSFLSTVKNQHSRDALVGRALSPLKKQMRSLQSGADAINSIIADFDARAYAIRDTIECIKLGERES